MRQIRFECAYCQPTEIFGKREQSGSEAPAMNTKIMVHEVAILTLQPPLLFE
jgi:hypothetical protein